MADGDAAQPGGDGTEEEEEVEDGARADTSEPDWEGIGQLLGAINTDVLKRMTKQQLIQIITDLLAVSSQVKLERERQFEHAVSKILNRNKANKAEEEKRRRMRIEKEKEWINLRKMEAQALLEKAKLDFDGSP